MADTLTRHQRSERMGRIRGKDTKPEMRARKLIHSMGYRYRLHRKDLPGNPDLVFPSRRKAIFIHGCFWHRHSAIKCRLARLPKSRLDFWLPKLRENHSRDRKNLSELKALGWGVMIIWECQIGKDEVLSKKIRTFLEGTP